MIFDQLANLITVILVAAAVVAAVFEEYVELGFIIAVIVANVLIGVVQEGRAQAATKAIAAMVTTEAVALRNGKKREIAVRELVPGDIIFLTAGDRVPADVRLVEVTALRIIESALTGESDAINKQPDALPVDTVLGDRTNMAFMGSLIVRGDATAMVVTTGDRAEIGRINKLVSDVKVLRTPLQQQIEHFSLLLSIACIAVVVLVYLVVEFGHDQTTKRSFELAVSVAVALIPEGLPTVVTITLALGVQELARNNAIVRQLPAVETLGAVTCVCSDKTGTLTKNEMTAVGVRVAGGATSVDVSGTGFEPNGALFYDGRALDDDMAPAVRDLLLPGALCNDATLLPVVSAYVHSLMQKQTVNWPSVCNDGPGGPTQRRMSMHRTPSVSMSVTSTTVDRSLPDFVPGCVMYHI
mgnify:CR=1 FL=1